MTQILILTSLGSVGWAMVGRSQPIPEANNVTATQVTEFTTNQFLIQGGATSGDGKNLFHGFDQFNLTPQQIATFNNNPAIANIFSRISGGNPSFIDGTIQILQGEANLYFLNPAGIVFGNNAQLNVPNDFIASTATAIKFENDWFNVHGTSDFANLFGNPTGFSFNTTTVGDLWVQGDLEISSGNLGLIGGRIVGTGNISTSQDLLITTVADQQVIHLREAGNILSLELETTALDLGNSLNFSVTKLPQLLTGSGDIQLNQIDAKYGIIAAENQLNLDTSLLQTQGHLALLGREISAQNTVGNSGLNLLFIGGELANIYQTQKPFLEAIAKGINFAIDADPLTGTPVIVTENLLDTVETSTLNSGDLNLVDSRFQAQNIYLLGNNIDLHNSQLNSNLNLNIFALDTIDFKDSLTKSSQLTAGQDIFIRGNQNIQINSFLNPDSLIRGDRHLFLATGDLEITEARLQSGANTVVNADNILIKNSQLISGNNLDLIASENLILEDIVDSQREPSYLSPRPLQLSADGELNLVSEDILRVMAPKTDSLLQGIEKITVTTAGDRLELASNFKSDGDIQVGSLTTPELFIEGGNWAAGGTLSWLAKDNLFIRDFHESELSNYGTFKFPLTVSANKINLAGNEFISIYLGKDSLLYSIQDFTFANPNKIYITGNLSSQGDLSIAANNLEIGINSLQLGKKQGNTSLEGITVGSDLFKGVSLDDPNFLEDAYFGGNLTAAGDISLFSQNRLTLTDFRDKPLNFAAQNVSLTSGNVIQLDAMNNANSAISTSQDATIISGNEISRTGRIRINSGEDILLQAPIISLVGSQFNATESVSILASDRLQISNSIGFAGVPPDSPFIINAPLVNLEGSNSINIDIVDLDAAKIASQTDLNLNSLNNIFISGNLSTTGDLNISSQDINLIQAQFEVGENLAIAAANKLLIEDVRSIPLVIGLNYDTVQFDVGKDIQLQGNNEITIQFYNEDSLIQSGNDTVLISGGNILNNAKYQVGNNFTIQDLNGQPADWQSTVPINNGFRSFYLKEGSLIPIGQANLAQVYAGGNVEFKNFDGRSLILEAGGTITAERIALDVPIAFGYPSFAGSVIDVRTRNFPDTLLSLTGGKKFTSPVQSIFVDFISVSGTLPFLRGTEPPELPDSYFSNERAQILDAISINDPFFSPLFLSKFAVGGPDTFITKIISTGGPSFGSFPINPPNARSLSLSASNSLGIGTTNINLTAIENPLDVPPSIDNPIDIPPSTIPNNAITPQVNRSEAIATDSVGNEREVNPLNPSATLCDTNATQQKKDLDTIQCDAETVQLAYATNDGIEQANTLYDLGIAYYQNNQYLESLKAHQERLKLAKSLQDPVMEIQSLQNIAQVYGALGEYDLALQSNREADTLFNNLSVTETSKLEALKQGILSNFGFLAYARGAYVTAIAHYQDSLVLARQLDDPIAEIEALNQLGLSYFQQTEYAQAKSLQQEALKLVKTLDAPNLELQTYEGLAIADYAIGNYDQAIQGFQRALALAQTVGDRHGEARNWSSLGDAQFKAGDNAASVQSLSQAIALWEELRADLGNADLFKVSLFETQETTYSTLQEVLLASNQPEAALEITERGRSRAFVELLQRGLATQANDLSLDAPDIQQIQRIAREQQATLVSYAIGREMVDDAGQRELVDSAIWIWVVQPDGQVTFRQQSLDSFRDQGLSINDLIRGSRCFGEPLCLARSPLGRSRSRSGETTENFDPSLQLLHQLLIEPIADLLPQNPEKQVVFIPHRTLFMVPFAALQGKNGKYLIEDHTIRLTPSIQALDLTRQQRQSISGTGITIVGNPTMPKGLEQLSGAEKEAKAIAAMFDTEILTGNNATQAAVTQSMQNSRFIHLATHGLLDGFSDDDQRKIPGAIALAPTEADDGFLTASEILALNLNSEMVVLSACDTGRGTITEDGVIGLSRSFMGAGVPSVVVSLWQVPDESTSDLMIEFYRQLKGNPDKAQSLRQAMLANLAKYENPQDWAAFLLMGEP